MAKPSPTERVSARMQAELQTQSARLVTKLQSEFNGPDRSNTSTATWHDVIRQNWADPAWRQLQSDRMGPVPFVHDALAAFGMPKSALTTSGDATPEQPMSMPTGPHLNPSLPIPPEATPQ